jgi:biopolymer transport protein ExbD
MHALQKQRNKPTSVEMAITPMLDMTFQLLFFFILNYHPPTNEGEINYNLPPPDATQGPAAEKPDPSSAEQDDLELKSQVTVLVRTQHDGINDGVISEIRVQEGTSGDTPIAASSGQPSVLLDELVTYLKKIRPGLVNQEDLFIQGDSRLKWSGMVSVMDACRKAGFSNVGFKAPGDT